jgi:hypothetical protein
LLQQGWLLAKNHVVQWHEHPNCRNKLVFESQKGKIWIQENQVCGIFQAYDESAPSGRFDRKKSSSLCLGQSGSHINELGHDRYSLVAG